MHKTNPFQRQDQDGGGVRRDAHLLPQTHHSNQQTIYMWNDLHRTPPKRWQKTLNLPKGQETLHITGWNKRKKRERKGIRRGLGLLRGSCERGKEPRPWEAAEPTVRSAETEGPQSLAEERSSWTEEGKAAGALRRHWYHLPGHHSLRHADHSLRTDSEGQFRGEGRGWWCGDGLRGWGVECRSQGNPGGGLDPPQKQVATAGEPKRRRGRPP